jgi:2,3-bisphosphoglycerate-independent phosphoglycerate mutase, archaeal form
VRWEMAGLLVILDGLGGRPTDFGGATCLERAAHPNLDELAAQGALGLMDPIAPGIRPGSDTAHLSIFGYDPLKVYTGRGAFEVLGIGMEVRGGDICFRANFATVEERNGQLIVLDRRAGRLEEGKLLEEAVNSVSLRDFGVEMFFRASTEHRGALVLRGEGLSAAVSDTDPHEAGVPVAEARPLEDTEAARRTAQILNAFTRRAYAVLRDHPVNKKRVAEGKLPGNAILLRGAAVMPHLVPVTEIYGIRAACIAGGALYKGVARLAGMEVLSVPGASGDLKTDLRAKAQAALEALRSFDLVFVHIKARITLPRWRCRGKKEVHRAGGPRVLRDNPCGSPKDLHICVSGDHTTLGGAGAHG